MTGLGSCLPPASEQTTHMSYRTYLSQFEILQRTTPIYALVILSVTPLNYTPLKFGSLSYLRVSQKRGKICIHKTPTLHATRTTFHGVSYFAILQFIGGSGA